MAWTEAIFTDLLIYGLLIDAVSSRTYTQSNHRIISENRNENDVKGDSRDVISGI